MGTQVVTNRLPFVGLGLEASIQPAGDVTVVVAGGHRAGVEGDVVEATRHDTRLEQARQLLLLAEQRLEVGLLPPGADGGNDGARRRSRRLLRGRRATQ
jgi:hypothetical protein